MQPSRHSPPNHASPNNLPIEEEDLTSENSKYDRSGHSTRRSEPGDLNVPGQSGGKDATRPVDMREFPGKTPKHRR
jgi:hypothetical protein